MAKAGKYRVTRGVLHVGDHVAQQGEVVDLSEQDANSALAAGVVVDADRGPEDLWARPDGSPLSLAEFTIKARADLEANSGREHMAYLESFKRRTGRTAAAPANEPKPPVTTSPGEPTIATQEPKPASASMPPQGDQGKGQGGQQGQGRR